MANKKQTVREQLAEALTGLLLRLDSLFLDDDLTDEKLRFWAEEQGPQWADDARLALDRHRAEPECEQPDA